MLDEIEEFITGVRGGSDTERVLTTIVFTDIVGSTERAALLGDDRWRDLLDNHDTIVRHELQRFAGREVNTAGDGFVATFTSPSAAIACADEIVDAVRVLGIEVRVGVHAGEVEVRGTSKKMMSPAWPYISERGSQRWPAPARCWCPRRCATSSPDHGTGSPTAANMHSKGCRATGNCALCCVSTQSSGDNPLVRSKGVRMTDVHVSLPPALRRAWIYLLIRPRIPT